MESGYDVFYSTVCHVCKNPQVSEEAKFCSDCKLVQYCSSSHQKEDWPNHKEFCKCIKKIMKNTGNKHIFEEASNLSKDNGENWNDLRATVVNLVKLILKRPLTSVETQIILFPPVCNFCYCYKSKKMITCYVCNTVMYCCLEHQVIDGKHKEVCKLLFLSHKIDIKRFFLQNDRAYNFRMLKDLNLNTPKNKQFPTCMENLFKTNGKSLSNEEALLSEPLSYLLTLAYVINCVAKVTDDSLTVHIIGADAMELLALNTLFVIFNLLPQLNSLKIVLIGPNLPQNISVPTDIHDKCSLRTISDVLYHDYINCGNGVTTSDEVRPDVIAVFNCGFCEFADQPEKDKWRKSLPCILSFHKSTVILTSYTEKESIADLNRLCQLKQNDDVSYKVLVKRKLNPFGSFYPHRDWEAQNDGVFYVNKFLSVLKTK